MERIEVVEGNSEEIATVFYQLDERVVDTLKKRGQKQQLSANSRETYKAAVRDYNRFIKENGRDVGSESLKLYFDTIRHKYRARTLNLRKSALKKVIEAQIGQDSIIQHLAIDRAFEKIESYHTDTPIALADCLSEAQVEQLMIAAAPKTRLIIYFLFKTACRVSEMIHIHLTDCTRQNGRVKIRVMGKGNKERDVKISEELYDLIRKTYGGVTWLFETPSGRPLNRNNVGHQIKRVGEMIGLSVSPHMLRHARATDMHLKKGVSLKALSQYLGHASVAVTAGMYLHDEVDYDELDRKDAF